MLKIKVSQIGDVSIPFPCYLVDGEYLRDNVWLDFTEAGNSLRYTWIPEGEFWVGIHDTIEIYFLLIHELIEVNFALQNSLDLLDYADYSIAHDKANEVEKAVRVAPNTAEKVLQDCIGEYLELTQTEDTVIWQN